MALCGGPPLARALACRDLTGPLGLAYEHHTIVVPAEVAAAVGALAYDDLFAQHLGRAHATPRQQRAFCDAVPEYTFAATSMPCAPRPPWLAAFTAELNGAFEQHFNSCVVHHFASGAQKLGEHLDNEDAARLRAAPVALVTLGAERDYALRCLDAPADRRSATRQVWRARHGDVRLVSAAALERWAVGVPKRTRVGAPHWLLVFRQIQEPPPEPALACPF